MKLPDRLHSGKFNMAILHSIVHNDKTANENRGANLVPLSSSK